MTLRWLYLEPILSGEAGEPGTKFRQVDSGYRAVARALEGDARLSALLRSPRLQPTLDALLGQLAACQHSLDAYIEEKRIAFPRFYFLSDDDLLELLGQARAAAGRGVVLRAHLGKLFPGLADVALGPGDRCVTALRSHHGDRLPLERAVDVDGPVEIWLKKLEDEMRSSLRSATLHCLDERSQQRDAFSLPTQVLCLAQNVRFTQQAERAIASRSLHELRASVEREGERYAGAEGVEGSEEEAERVKRRALALQCSHYCDVLRLLIDNDVTSKEHWLWQKQLRFYLLSNKDIVARMGLAQIVYSYEYLGLDTGQFVRTELTDQCFLVLTQAFHLGLVGNPFGPAGTGKTESVKALGALVGRLVLVFNCDEATDATCTARLLTGLARSGAWGCFDEFNRLSADTLALVSHQLSSLLAAMTPRAGVAHSPVAVLSGKEVAVSEWCGVLVTLNPAGRGYGGRRALPAALARLLRPSAVCRPPAAPLAHHLLAARALHDPRETAYALAEVFSMAQDLLSWQQHYDWGLRALKTVVGSCGRAVEAARAAGGGALSREQQRGIVLRAARLNTMSKLTFSDAKRFDAILAIAFPGVAQEEEPATDLDAALIKSYKALDMVYNKEQVHKCKELYEQLQQRMGVVIVGPPGSGKTAIRQLLKNALNQLGGGVTEHVICPKAMSRSLLLGHIDHDTRQWTDGVVSATALEVSNQSSEVWSWVVCDGDVEPEWAESLNSVLDDNRLLTLPSGWRVHFPPRANFIFETHSLRHASPATVSRLAVVLLGDEDSCATETVETWAARLGPDDERARAALPVLRDTLARAVRWARAHRNEFVQKLFSVALVKQVLVQFDYIVECLERDAMSASSPEDVVYSALRRGVAPALKAKAADRFIEEVCGGLAGGLEADAAEAAGGWRGDVLLSPRLARAASALAAAARASHALLIGVDACAKNLLAEHVLKESNDKLLISIYCTPLLEPTDIIEELKRNNVVRAGGGAAAGGGAGGGAVLLVKSLHRARVDAWGSSAVQAFLLQLIQHGGFWERWRGAGAGEGAAVQWCSAPGLQVVMTMSPGHLCPRLANAAALTLLREPDDDELAELAVACLGRSVQSKEIVEHQIKKVAGDMLMLYKEVSDTLVAQPHYAWCTADLTRWCDNVRWYRPSDVDSLLQAVHAEADCIFRNRLTSEQEACEFDAIRLRYMGASEAEGTVYTARLQRDGVFMEPTDYKDWCQGTQKIINQCMSENEQNVFGEGGAEVCREMATLCAAITRSMCGGVAVCAGSAGAGRRAAARVVAASLPAVLYSVYDPRDLNTTLKNAISSAGSEGNKCLVVVEECAAAVALGAAEALARAATAAQLPRELRPALAQRADATALIDNLKQNLGIVILVDKDDAALPGLLAEHPSLQRRARVVWLRGWSGDTLRRAPRLLVQRLMQENIAESPEEENDSIPIDGFINIYSSLESEAMLAPCRYVALVRTYYHINRRKKRALLKRQETLRAGVSALTKARTEVSAMKSDAARQEAALSDKQQKASHALDQIGATVTSATGHKEELQALRSNMESENAKLQVRKGEIEAELAGVEPVMAAARAAVGELRPEALSEVRSLRAPPDVVRDVLEGVLRLMGIADTSWHSMKNFLAKRGIKEDIRNMDASDITEENLASVERLLERRGGSFEERAARRASAACAPLAAWVRANVAYAAVLQRVRPLQQQQRTLHQNLADAEAQLAALSSGLQSVDERVADLKEQLGRYTKEALEIELKLTAAKDTITNTESLVDQLSEEYRTWERDLENISQEIGEINIRSLLAAAYVVYLSDVPEDQCRIFLEKWSKGFDFDVNNFSVLNFLSTVEEQLKWNANGLPSNVSAIKNAVIVTQALQQVKCGFTPLIIDPDGDASAWLRSLLAERPSNLIAQHSDKLNTALQHATRSGTVLVVEGVTELGARWTPLLRGTPPAPHAALHADFRLLLYSRDATLSARLPRHHRALLSLVDFTPNREGLADQLINFALQHEKPEINEKMNALKVEKASLQKQQHELQENLLKELSRNADILRDARLLDSLRSARATGATVARALADAGEVERQTARLRDKYRASAARAAAVAPALRELARAACPLVAVPGDTLAALYIEAADRGKMADNPEVLDSDAVVQYLTRRVIERVLLSVHKQDKFAVILHLLRRIYENHFPKMLWDIFIGTVCNIDDAIVKDLKTKISSIPEENIPSLANLKAEAPELYDKLNLEDAELWRAVASGGDLGALTRLPLAALERVVAVQAARPESLYSAISSLVTSILGAGGEAGGAAAGGVAAGARWARVGAPRAVLLLGAHAADQLAAHAAHTRHNLVQVVVSAEEAEWQRELGAALERARGAAGSWLALQLGAAPFSRHLQAFLTSFAAEPQEVSQDPEFRLWVVSEEREIPPLVANTCISVLLEAPEGVRNNVAHSLAAWADHKGADARAARSLFCVALLHAVVQERRAYTPQGWTQWYEFEWGDAAAARSVVTSGAPPAAAAGLVGALYAGRVTGAGDARVLRALVRDHLGEGALAHAWRPRGVDAAPPAGQLQAYNSFLSAFPPRDTPALLGLAANARAAADRKAADRVLARLRELNTAASLSVKRDNTTNIKSILSLWRKLMSGSALIKGDYNIDNTGAAGGWWGAALAGEASAAARACSLVHSALAAAAAAPAASAALVHQVPEEWQLVWSGPELPARYVRELCHRAAHAEQRLRAHSAAPTTDDAIPAEIDLRSLFKPQRLIAALKAATADALKCPLESLTLSADWDPKTGVGGVCCTVRGLQLEGAAWSAAEGCLVPVDAAAPPRAPAPPIRLYYTRQAGEAPVAAGCAELPLYSGPARAELVAWLRAPLAARLPPATAAAHPVALAVADL